jgi:hypothetical protein
MSKAEYLKEVDESSFDPERLDLYWRFITERQLVLARRLADLPGPWTTDPIMAAEFITNMYRELDPGTEYVINEILEYEKPVDVVFNVMMYRLMGSQPDTHELIHQTAKKFSTDEMIDTLRGVDMDFKIFGDAYRVAAYHEEGGADKVENVARMFAKFAVGMPETMRRLKACTSTKDAFAIFKGMQGMGEFLAHQITVDLLYGDDPVLPFGDNEWAQAGPGARSGIWAMIKPGLKPSNLLMVMEWLRDNQTEQLEKRGLMFPWPINEEGQTVPLSLCNIQSTLCEYYKYVRIWSGEKTGAVRKYDYDRATVLTKVMLSKGGRSEWLLEPAVTPQPPVNEDGEVVASEQDSEPVADTDASYQSVDYSSAQPMSATFTAPDGRAVTINITINLA